MKPITPQIKLEILKKVQALTNKNYGKIVEKKEQQNADEILEKM